MSMIAYVLYLLPVVILALAVYLRVKNTVPVTNARAVGVLEVTTMLLLAVAFIVGRLGRW